jgi:hypothetical protein
MTSSFVATQRVISILGLTLALQASAWAAPARKTAPEPTPPVRQTHLVREPVTVETQPFSQRNFGVGLAAVEALTSSSTALTATYQLNPTDLVQGFFALDSTSPIGRFNVAGLYKHSVHEAELAGFHVGAGLGAGNYQTTKGGVFGFALAAVGGIHLAIPGISHVKIHLDGGPVFTMIDNETNLSIKALSPALGLSVFYQF